MDWNLKNDKGAALLEWGILAVLIAIVALIAVQFTGQQNSLMWSQIASAMP